ncbi:unnamed protein product [Lepeophtheirus salmonis]|uniref:(salmon louse) hypothetical protein n=1 Tax=Lepeophtheirus salmonis TaxID=72036 RepID=A0A7R8D2K9_LEPSM|nr:unnamed protein product [Lepeophtheirus salmonis]CAF3006590.1 unnamed protein product [Lepeophtheirus salmonis]
MKERGVGVCVCNVVFIIKSINEGKGTKGMYPSFSTPNSTKVILKDDSTQVYPTLVSIIANSLVMKNATKKTNNMDYVQYSSVLYEHIFIGKGTSSSYLCVYMDGISIISFTLLLRGIRVLATYKFI